MIVDAVALSALGLVAVWVIRLGVRQINVMTDARQTSESRLHQFVADASHELRTPLTSIRGYADLYRSGRMREPADVEDLLLLARLDEGRPLESETIDLSTIAHDDARLRRVIANLLTNAMIHTPDTDSVSIAVWRSDDGGVVVVSTLEQATRSSRTSLC